LICSSCGTVEDVPASSRLEQSVQKAADEIARRTGFRTQHHRVDLVGLCARCA
jgi:Fe2+ or Zn2+ uptake regulation protein